MSPRRPVPARDRKRIGRGHGSGHEKTAGFGQKGQKARTGHHKAAPHFQGGQTQMSQQLPYKRGFKNHFRVSYQPVSVDQLQALETDLEITPELLVAAGILRDLHKPVKILGGGELTKALRVSADRFSASARQAIEAAGGTATALTVADEELVIVTASGEPEGSL